MSTTPRELLALTVAAFRNCGFDDTIAAVATADGGVARLTYGGDLDLLHRELLDARERLDRISTWHSRETGPAGMVGDLCNECGHDWPVHAFLDTAQALRWVANCNDRDRPRLWMVDLTNPRPLRVVPAVEARLEEEVPDGG